MIGIIGAMSVEVDALCELIENKSVKTVGQFVFNQGKICGKEVVVCRSGVGKVASASLASLMIYLYNPTVIINIGVAGGAKPLQQGDIVVAERTVQHDYDGVADGLTLGQVHGFDSPYFDCDKQVVDQLCSVLDKKDYNYKVGTMSSGDCFVSDRKKSSDIVKTFGAISFDMESAAINQVCQSQGVKFTAMRAISDNGDDEAVKSFYEFLTEACARSTAVISEFIKNFA